MKRLIVNLLTSLGLAVVSAPAWADTVYTCEGDQGERLYTELPCPSDVPRLEGRVSANKQMIETLSREIVSVKRQLMDLDREVSYLLREVEADEAPAVRADFETKSARLRVKLSELEQARSLRVIEQIEHLGSVSVGDISRLD